MNANIEVLKRLIEYRRSEIEMLRYQLRDVGSTDEGCLQSLVHMNERIQRAQFEMTALEAILAIVENYNER